MLKICTKNIERVLYFMLQWWLIRMHRNTKMPQLKPKSYLDLAHGFLYQPTIGFRVAVDGLHNVKGKAGCFFKVLCSVFPPGSFYQTPRVAKDVHFTTATDWMSAQTSPEFTDGYMVRLYQSLPLPKNGPDEAFLGHATRLHRRYETTPARPVSSR